MSTTPLIELSGINKIYPLETKETHALSNINLQIYQGEYVYISGQSGGGKSTLLASLGLLDGGSSGK